MLICTGGKVETTYYKKKKQNEYVIRLYLVDDETRKKTSKRIPTGLSATRANKREAERLCDREKSKHSSIGSSTDFSTYCVRWLEGIKGTLEVTTYETYAYRIRHITSYFDPKGLKLCELTPAVVNDFYLSLLETKKTSTSQREEVGLSNRTIKDIVTVLRAIIRNAYLNDGAIDERDANRIINLKAPKRPESPAERRHIDISMYPVLFSAIKGNILEGLFTIAILFGLRRSEILGLKWSAIRDGRLHIENTVVRVNTLVEKDRTKTKGSQRGFLITDLAKKTISEAKVKQNYYRKLHGDSYHESDYIFTWEDGRPFDPGYVSRRFAKIVREHDELPNSLRLHDLRASFVTRLIEQGSSFRSVQNLSGHDDIETMLKIYNRANHVEEDEQLTQFSSALESAIQIASKT